MAAALWSEARLADALAAPDYAERLSVLHRRAPLAIALQSGAEWPPALLQRLALLPTVTVGVGEGGGALAARLDAVVQNEAALSALQARVAAAPLASLALVQLLRRSEAMPVEQAVLAESAVYSMLQAGPEFAAWLRENRRRKTSAVLKEGEGAPVQVQRKGARLLLRFNRPRKRNAFSAAMRDALCEALQLALRDSTIGGVELSGAGPAFCSGGDLAEFGTAPDPATANAVRATRSPALLLAALRPRVQVQLHGACFGAGMELPAFCARVSAREGAQFCLPEISLGLVPGAGGTASLPRRIGRQRTAWLALSGARINCSTALRWGLVDEVQP